MHVLRQNTVTLNENVCGLEPSATIAINEQVLRLREEGAQNGTGVVDLGLGESPFPVPEPVVDALRASAHEKRYLPVKGLPALRDAVADYYRDVNGVAVAPERVLIGPGSKELMFLLQLVFDGEIVIPTPCWVSYVPQAQILGRDVRLLPTSFDEGWKLTPARLDAFLREARPAVPRLLVLNYPANPHGITYTDGELRGLARVAREHGLTILSDEIYGQLHFRGEHASIARHYPEGTIISSGLSKWCGAGGWRLGTFTFPENLEWVLDAMECVASETYTSVSAPIQHAAVRAFRMGPEIEAHLRHSRRVLDALADRCTGLLRDAGARLQDPKGAFYLFPDFSPLRGRLEARGIRDSRGLCTRLLDEAHVATLPGADFQRPPGELTARLSLVDFDGAAALAASRREGGPLSAEFVDEWCGRTVEGVERIVDWLDA